jgi:antiviral helicase SLH1
VGRIASNYYILNTSIGIFNTMMNANGSEADVLKMISMSGEFDQIKYRGKIMLHKYRKIILTRTENEDVELGKLAKNAPCDIEEGKTDTPHGKTNVLLQAYISRASLDDFALMSDSAYVAQNSARIARALFLIALDRRMGYLCQVLLSICKSIEKRYDRSQSSEKFIELTSIKDVGHLNTLFHSSTVSLHIY